MYAIYNCEVTEWLDWSIMNRDSFRADTIFIDPPDNIGLRYSGFNDRRPAEEYYGWIDTVLRHCIAMAEHTWISFNAIHTLEVSSILRDLRAILRGSIDAVNVTTYVQTYTFGQHQHFQIGNGHRPLYLISKEDADVFPDAIRVPSWRQQNGDKRADPRGKVPLSNFDFPRVTGNSTQRRRWHKTQLNEGLVERCLKYTTPPGGQVVDLCSGTGTTLRVAKSLGYRCESVEISKEYATRIGKENGVRVIARRKERTR